MKESDVNKIILIDNFIVCVNDEFYQKFRGNPARIEIDCKPDFSVCSDAMYHELGHHVYKGLGAQAKSNLESALALRIKKPDAKKFRAEVKRLSDTNKRFIQLWSKYFSRYFHCNSMQSEIRLVNKVFATHGTCQQIMKKSKSRGKKYLCNDKALNDLKKQAAAFRKSMPNCNWKSLTKAHRMLNTLGKRFSKNMTTVYHKKGGVKYKRLQEIKGFPLADVNGVLYRIERKKFLDLTRIVLTDTAAAYQYQNPLDSKTKSNYAKVIAYFQQTGYQFEITLAKHRHDYEQKTLRGVHDSRKEEQFAGAFDSLMRGYKGGFQTGPLLFRLDDKLSKAMYKNISDKGVKKKMMKYRAKVLRKR